jgi:PAS domain S-box-containing protein
MSRAASATAESVPGEVVRLRQFLRWLAALTACFSALELVAGVVFRERTFLVAGAILLPFLGVAILARRVMVRSPGRAALLAAYGLLGVAAVTILFVRFAVPTLLLIPFLAVVAAMPLVRGTPFGVLLGVSFAVAVWVALVGFGGEASPPVPTGVRAVLYVGSIAAAAALILLLLFQYNSRIRAALEAAVASEAREGAARREARAVLEAIPQMVWAGRPDGTIEYVNAHTSEHTGLRAEATEEEWRNVFHPEDRARVGVEWARASSAVEPFETEARVRRVADNTYRWHLLRAVPVANGHSGVVKWLGTATDIDDRKRSEMAARFVSEATQLLSASLDYHSTLQQLTNLAVPRMADSCLIYLTQGEELLLHGVAHADPQKVEWARQLAERYIPRRETAEGLYHVVRTGEPVLVPALTDAMLAASARDPEELRLMGELGMRSIMIVPLRAGGKTLGAMSFISAQSGHQYTKADLALALELAARAAQAVENARLYDEAQEAVRVRDDFLSIASHELKTPLTPLQIHLQTLHRLAMQEGAGELRADRLAARLENAIRQVSRLGKLVNSLLDISRITGRRLELETESVDLARVVMEVAERFHDETSRARCEIDVDAPDPVRGEWDPLRLEQIVSNLISNACKFGAGNPVKVSARREADSAVLTVRDRGIGIAQEDQRRIFERFERAVPSKHYGGFGLGLWIVRQIVEAMGGSIYLHSRLGEGTTFQVTLPLSPPLRAPDNHASVH